VLSTFDRPKPFLDIRLTDMKRYNLWLTIAGCSKVICYGRQEEMNDLALGSGKLADYGQVHVLPDGLEPDDVLPSAPLK